MKRFISIMLTLTLISSLFIGFGVNVSAATAPSAESVKAAKTLCTAVGISPLTDETQFVLRDEFITAVVNVLKLGSEGLTVDSLFADVKDGSELAAVTKIAVDLGLISKATNFEPSRPITYNEAIKILVTALGFGVESKYKGGYPVGYHFIAKREGVVPAGEYVGANSLTADDFYVLMRNFLEAPTRLTESVISSGNKLNETFKDGAPILQLLYDWDVFEGQIIGNSKTFLFNGKEKLNEGKIQIGDTIYTYDGTYILGSIVKGYSVKDGKNTNIVFMELSDKTDIVTIPASKINSLSESKVETWNEKGNRQEYALDSLHSTIYNGKYEANALKGNPTVKIGGITLIDSDGNGGYDVVDIRDGEIMHVGSVNKITEKIYDSKSGKTIDISDTDEMTVIRSGSNVGVGGISAESIIEVYRAKDNVVTEVRVLENKITGTYNSKNNDKINIDGVNYTTTDYFKTYNLPGLVLNSKNTFVLTENGEIACLTSAEKTSAIFAWLTDWKAPEILETDIEVRLYNEYGEFVTLQTAPKVLLNGVSVDGAELYELLSGKKVDTALLREAGEQAIMYKKNSDGKINVINTASLSDDPDDVNFFNPSKDSADKLKRYQYSEYTNPGASGNDDVRLFYKSFGSFVPYFTVDGSTKMLMVVDRSVTSNPAERFGLASLSTWTNDSRHVRSNTMAFNVEESGHARYMVAKVSSTAGALFYKSPAGMISDIIIGLNNEEKLSYIIEVAGNNKFSTIYVPLDKEVLVSATNVGGTATKLTDASGNMLVEKGDFIRYSADTYGNVERMCIDFDFSKEEVLKTQSRHMADVEYYFGYARAFNPTAIGLDGISYSYHNDDKKPVALYSDIESAMVYDTKTGEVSVATASSMITKNLDPVNPDRVLLYVQAAKTLIVIIYR